MPGSLRAIRGPALVLVLVSSFVLAAPASEKHLLAGADHFRAGRFEAALVEFKVSRQLGGRGEVDWYLAATLTKLHRVEEALETFAAARAQAPNTSDPLLDYYHAMACYEARLLTCADALLAGIQTRAGPRIAGQARKVRADIGAVLSDEPPGAAIDAVLEQGQVALKVGRRALATAYFQEAAALASRREDRHGAAKAQAGLSAAKPEAQADPQRLR